MGLKKEQRVFWGSICLICFVITLQQVGIPMLTGKFFGSEGDWISQHVAIAETLRDAMIQSKSLIPQFVQLGAGSSVYNFSYYGLLRPDVIGACFFPQIPVRYVIAGYALLGIYASGILTYIWLRKKNLQNKIALFGALMLSSSTAFYHAHHQIMFINYMPFLLLAMIGVDRIIEKKKSSVLIFSCLMICMHSFYYAPACIFVIGLYSVSQCIECTSRVEKKRMGNIAIAIAIAIGVAMILLLPTALEIISGSKDGGQFADQRLQIIWPDIKGLLYSPYSCGLTFLALFSIIHCIIGNRKRMLAILTLICMAVPLISLVLNGGLYAREKILIPFLPICVLLTTLTLQKLWNQKETYDVLALVLCAIPAMFSKWKIFAFAEIGILFIWIFLQRSNKAILRKVRTYTFGLCLLPIVSSMLFLNLFCENGYISTKEVQQDIPQEFLEKVAKEKVYRTEILDRAFTNGNLTKKELKRTTMYSSVTNPMYATFFYDTMKNPIGYNNRVALIAGEHPYFNYFMGIKYLIANKNQAPLGYKKIMEEGTVALFENEEVLPICYGTTQVMSREQYKQLAFPDTLEALCTSAVVETNTPSVRFSGHAKKINPEELQDSFQDKIRILQFHVQRKDANQVVIAINHIKNKLSSNRAPYPNHNTDFTYVMNASHEKTPISVQASKGAYKVMDRNAYILDHDYLKHKEIIKPENETIEGSRNQVFLGKITMQKAGYFITSYPWKKGYQVYVDGKRQEPEIVNTAFLGFPLEKGMHKIEIQFEAFGYTEGKIITSISLSLWGLLIFIEWKNKEEKQNEK